MREAGRPQRRASEGPARQGCAQPHVRGAVRAAAGRRPAVLSHVSGSQHGIGFTCATAMT